MLPLEKIHSSDINISIMIIYTLIDTVNFLTVLLKISIALLLLAYSLSNITWKIVGQEIYHNQDIKYIPIEI